MKINNQQCTIMTNIYKQMVFLMLPNVWSRVMLDEFWDIPRSFFFNYSPSDRIVKHVYKNAP